jgi:hypothetical protein
LEVNVPTDTTATKPNALDVGPILVALGIPRHQVAGFASAAFNAGFDAVKAFGREDREAGVACVCGLVADHLPLHATTEQVETIGTAAWLAYTENRQTWAAGRELFVSLVVGSANQARKKLRQENPLRVVKP